MLDLLGQTFFQHALIAGTLVGATCSLVGVYVLLKRIAFLAIALAQDDCARSTTDLDREIARITLDSLRR
jgi:hypothetical protein